MMPRIKTKRSKTGAVKMQKPPLPRTGKPNLRKMKGLPRV
jgi:hypothetical protein